MACEAFYTSFLHKSHLYLPDRFRWADCQLKYLADCDPPDIRRALNTLPETLDDTYERTLRAIKKWKSARRLFFCVAVASRPLRVEELADILAFDFETEQQTPKFNKKWRQQNPVQAVLSTCSTLLSVVNVRRSYYDDRDSEVVQFAHFTVKEFLTFDRLAEKDDAISRYRISMTDAHTLLAQACLGILLHLGKDVTRDDLKNFPLAEYAAEHWLEHARFEGVSQNVAEGMQQVFDRRKHHLAVWLWMYDPTLPYWRRGRSAEVPPPPRGTPLHYAAFCGLHHVVETLAIEFRQDVNSRDFDDESMPLHLASREGHGDVTQILFKHGADTEARTKDGETPLHLASQQNHVELARFLLKHGANTETRTKDEETLLHWASSRGHVELSRLLLEHGANVAAQTKDGETPLHLASQRNHAELAQLLLRHHADVAAQTKDGETPLHLTTQLNHVKLTRLLCEHGADVAAQTKDGVTPLHLAFDFRNLELAQLLLKHVDDVTAQTKDGETLLHLASEWGHVTLAQLLLKHGADVAAENKDGETPLHRASHWGHVELARLLLEHSANVAAETKDGETPLHWVSHLGHVELARVLLEHSANVAARSKDGETPLHWASYRGHVKLARLLLERGANVAARNKDGETPLHWTSDWGNVKLARLLLEYGADAAAKTNNGSTPLQRASYRGHIELMGVLEHSADVTSKAILQTQQPAPI
jgi:ankyrin repeat protein